MHRIRHLAIPAFLVLAVALFAAPAQAKPDASRLEIAPYKVGTVKKPKRPIARASASLWDMNWQAGSWANHRCGEYYRVWGGPCAAVWIEWGSQWVPGWTGAMAQAGVAWRNNFGGNNLTCRAGLTIYAQSGQYYISYMAQYPERCSWAG